MAKYLDLSGLSRLWGKITSKAVMADRVMSLSASEQSQARANIGAANTNPNLLRNWYWVGGGTAGKFPVNQRGKNYYEVNDYTIDGWKSVDLYGSSRTVKVTTQNEGLVLAGNTNNQATYVQFQQTIDNPPYGKTVTLSVLTDNVGPDDEGNYPQIWCGASAYKNITAPGLTSVTFTYPTDTNENYIRIILYDGAATASSIRIQAVKLEIGNVSTLEQDAAPDYGVELARCIYSKADSADTYANNGFGRSNPNLLDNAYFVGGGSQLGDGIFPINQRGQVSYGTSMYTVDRWRTWSDMAVGVTASGLSLTSTNSGGGLFQYPQQSKVANAIGQQMTFSVELNGTIYSATGQVYLGAWIPIDIPIQGVSAIFVVPNNYPSELISVSVRMDGAISTPVLFTRAKLEVGTVSTLANDAPPDFGEELRKCQRYFVRFSPKVNSRAYIGTGSANNSNNMLIFVPTPVTLRTTPTVSFSMCNCYNWVAGGSIGLNSITLDSWSDNGVFVSCAPAVASQAPQGEPYALRVASGGFFNLSCEP